MCHYALTHWSLVIIKKVQYPNSCYGLKSLALTVKLHPDECYRTPLIKFGADNGLVPVDKKVSSLLKAEEVNNNTRILNGDEPYTY